MTEATITDVGTLRVQLAEIRARGWSSDEGENADGIACVAVPLPSPIRPRTPCRARCRRAASGPSGASRPWAR